MSGKKKYVKPSLELLIQSRKILSVQTTTCTLCVDGCGTDPYA
jgi:hypothetical protein